LKGYTRLKLALFINQPVRLVGNSYVAYYASLIDFALLLRHQFESVDLCLPLADGKDERAQNTIELPSDRVRIIRLPFYLGLDVSLRSALKRFAGALRLAWQQTAGWDLVGCVLPSVMGTAFALAARLQGKPLFLIVRGDKRRVVEHAASGPRWKRRILGWAAELMEAPCRYLIGRGVPAFVFGEQLLESYRKHGPRVFPLNAILGDQVRPAAERRFHDPRQLAVVYVGRLSGEKGLLDLLEAMRLVCDRLPDRSIRLRIVGEGPMRADLEGVARQLGLGEQVEFRGLLPFGRELFEEYNAADVFVLPSYTEALGAVLLEAMALGVPVVGTRVGGIVGLIEDGRNGLLVDPHAPHQLADAICRFAQSPALVDAVRAGGFKTAPRYTLRQAARDMVESLRTVYPQLQWATTEKEGGVSAKLPG